MNSQFPDVVWVRHRGAVVQRHVGCPDAWPFSTVAALRHTAQIPATVPYQLRNVLDEGIVTVTGVGTPDDPMHSPEMDAVELSPCSCMSAVAE